MRLHGANGSNIDTIEVPIPPTMDSIEVINLDNLPEEMAAPRQHQRSEHDQLYRMIKSDATNVLNRHGLPVTKTSINIPGGSRFIKIRDDTSGAVRIIDKSIIPEKTRLNHMVQENKAIASLPREEKKRKLQASIDSTCTVLKHLEQENNTVDKRIPIIQYSSLDRLNRKVTGRTKSMAARDLKYFKVGGLAKKSKRVDSTKPKLDRNPDWLSNALSSSAASTSTNTNSGSDQSGDDIQMDSGIDTKLLWNANKTSGRLPHTSILFEKNEFGMLEMNTLGMIKYKAVLSKKLPQNDHMDFPKLPPSMACGHSVATECFDEIVSRILNDESTSQVNGRRPHQLFSTEFKEIVGALVQNNNNNCRRISKDDIRQALTAANLQERIRTSDEFDWNRFIRYYKQIKPEISMAPSSLFVSQYPAIPVNTFEIGQKLEAIDPQNSGLFCVCTIVEKCGYRIKLRFDGYPAMYDFWVNADSVNIFPAGFCNKTGRRLECPGRINPAIQFDWQEYLKKTNTIPAHRACFTHLNNAVSVVKEIRSSTRTKLILKSLPTKKTNVNPFKVEMKFEADHKRTGKILAASVGDVIDSRILVKFDGFDETTNYWTDITSPNIHPVNWHAENGFSLQSPPSKFHS